MFKQISQDIRNQTNRQLQVSMRTDIGELYYIIAKKIGATKPFLKEKRLKEWKYWVIIDNAFPYSAVFQTHHMLIPKRVVCEDGLDKEERVELKKILKGLRLKYDCQMTNFTSKQSVKNHYHIHLMIYKDKRTELKF